MSEEGATATVEVSKELQTLGDNIAELTLKDAKALSDYLKDAHGIEAAAGGAVMVGGGGGGGGAAEEAGEKTEFDVILTGFGDKKIGVIKEIRAITGLGLKEAKELVESCPKACKEGASKEDCEAIKKKLEEAGASCEIK